MDKTFTASEVRELAEWLSGVSVMGTGKTCHMLRAYADRLEADEKTQAQRGSWVLVPREPTDGMLQAAEDAVNAASNCESTTDNLSAIAYKAALAAAPQSQAAEPFMYTWSKEPDKDGVFRKIPLYTHPQPAQDVKDAARLEWYFGPSDKKDWLDTYMRGMREGWSVGQWKAAIDTAMAKESGR